MTVTNISQISSPDINFGFRSITQAISILASGTIDEETILISSSGRLAGSVTISQSQMRFHNPGNSGNENAVLTYGLRENTAAKVKIIGASSLIFSISGTRANILISEISEDSEIIETTAGKLYVYTQTDAILKDCVFRGIKNLELYRSPLQFFNVTLIDTQIAMLNWEAGRIDRFGVNIPSTTSTWESWLGTGNNGNNSFWDWNLIEINQEKIVHQHSNSKYYAGYTASYKFIDRDTGDAIENVQVDFRDDESDIGDTITSRGKYTSKPDGTLEGFYDSKNRTTNSNKTDLPTIYILAKKSKITTGITSTGIGNPSTSNNYTLDSISHELIIKSYEYDVITTPHSISSEKGKINSTQTVTEYENYIMSPDLQLTEKSKSIVDAYDTIDNENQLYDRFKSYWRDTDDINMLQKDGVQLNLGEYDLVITNNPSAESFSFSQNEITIKVSSLFQINTKITTTGTITTVDTAKIQGKYEDVTGSTIQVQSTINDTRLIYTLSPSSITGYAETRNSISKKDVTIKIPTGQTMRITAKAEGYDPTTISLDNVALDSQINLLLSKNTNVDLTQSLDGWFFDGEEKNFTISDSLIDNPKAVYFYDDKIWVYGVINNRGKIQSYDTNGIPLSDSFFNFNINSIDIDADDTYRYEISDESTGNAILSYLHASRATLRYVIRLHGILDNSLSIVQLDEKIYILASNLSGEQQIFIIDKNPISTTNPPFTTISLSENNTNAKSISSDGTYLYVSDVPQNATHTMYVYDPRIVTSDKSVIDKNFVIEPMNMDTKSTTYGINSFWILDDADDQIYTHRGTGEYHRLNAMYLQYVKPNANDEKQKSLLQIGVTNIKDDQEISKRLFDKLMTSNAGLKWCHENENNNTNLGGYPYAIRSDRILIDENIFDAVKISNVTEIEHSTFGITLHHRDFFTAYLPPVNQNGEVEINSLAEYYNVTQGALSRALQNKQTQIAFSNSVNNAENIKKILEDTDNLKDHIQTNSTLPNVATFEHLGIIDWDGAGVTRTVNPTIPNSRVQSISVNNDGKLEILFNTHDFGEWFTLDLLLDDERKIPFTLTGNEKIYMETDASFQDATIPIDRLSITPEIDIELAGTINGNANQLLTRVPITARVELKERGIPKPFKFNFGKIQNADITNISIYFKLPSSETNQTKLILDNFRVFKSIQRDITDYRADVSTIETDVKKIYKRLANRKKVNVATNKIEYYDDDKSTILETSSLKNATGTASSSEIYDEVPDA